MLEESCSLTQPVGRLKFGNVPVGFGVSLSSCTFFVATSLLGARQLVRVAQKGEPAAS